MVRAMADLNKSAQSVASTWARAEATIVMTAGMGLRLE